MGPDESGHRGYKPLPRGPSSTPLWERPLAATSAGAWVGMTEKGGRIQLPSVPVTPVPDQVRDDGPGVHVDRVKVAGKRQFQKVIPKRSPLPPVIPRSGATRDLGESATVSRHIPKCRFLAGARNDNGKRRSE
jgi:hypothetical protein